MIILVYDITKRSTFLSLQRWVEEVRRYTSSHVLLVLVGTTILCIYHTRTYTYTHARAHIHTYITS